MVWIGRCDVKLALTAYNPRKAHLRFLHFDSRPIWRHPAFFFHAAMTRIQTLLRPPCSVKQVMSYINDFLFLNRDRSNLGSIIFTLPSSRGGSTVSTKQGVESKWHIRLQILSAALIMHVWFMTSVNRWESSQLTWQSNACGSLIHLIKISPSVVSIYADQKTLSLQYFTWHFPRVYKQFPGNVMRVRSWK